MFDQVCDCDEVVVPTPWVVDTVDDVSVPLCVPVVGVQIVPLADKIEFTVAV